MRKTVKRGIEFLITVVFIMNIISSTLAVADGGNDENYEFDCIDFDEIYTGTRYYVTDSFVGIGYHCVFDAFQWCDNQWTLDGFAEVDINEYSGGTGRDLNLNNINLYVFYEQTLDGLVLNFGEYGGNLNIEVNGEFRNFDIMPDLNGQTIGGVEITVTIKSDVNKGILKLEGDIDSFAIGGQELWIDDICPHAPFSYPDLVVDIISAPESAFIGRELGPITIEIKNIGEAPSNPKGGYFHVDLVLSYDTNIVYGEDTLLIGGRHQLFDIIQPGESIQVTFNGPDIIPDTILPNLLNLGVLVDSVDNHVVESCEYNNDDMVDIQLNYYYNDNDFDSPWTDTPSWAWKFSETVDDVYDYINGFGLYDRPHAVGSIAYTPIGFYIFYRGDLQATSDWGWKKTSCPYDAIDFLNGRDPYINGPIEQAEVVFVEDEIYIFYRGVSYGKNWTWDSIFDFEDYSYKIATSTKDALDFLNGVGTNSTPVKQAKIIGLNNTEFIIFYNYCNKPDEIIPTTPTYTGDLVGHWKFDEGEGNVTMDSSGYDNHGEIKGATWSKDGVNNCSLYFNGFADYINVLNSPSLDITEEITITAWIKPESTCGRWVLTKPNYKIGGSVYGLDIYPGKFRATFHKDDGNSYVYEATTTSSIQKNEWQHIAVTWDGTTIKVFYNGHLEDTSPFVGKIESSTGDVEIGRYKCGNFHGYMDEVRIYKKALNDSEILSIFTKDCFTCSIDDNPDEDEEPDEPTEPSEEDITNDKPNNDEILDEEIDDPEHEPETDPETENEPEHEPDQAPSDEEIPFMNQVSQIDPEKVLLEPVPLYPLSTLNLKKLVPFETSSINQEPKSTETSESLIQPKALNKPEMVEKSEKTDLTNTVVLISIGAVSMIGAILLISKFVFV